MTGQTADDLLMGGGATFFSTAARNNIGQFVTKPYGQQGRTYISGYIDSIGEIQQQTDYNTGALLTWNDGKPRQQFPIILNVDWQNTLDWNLENNQWVQAGPTAADDTKRGVMVKQSSDLQGKLRDAIKKSGADGLKVGAYITVELVGEVPGQGNPRKDHAVTYTPPAQGMMMDGAQQQQQVPQAPPQQAQQQMPMQQGGYVQPQQQAPAPQAPPQQVQQPMPPQQLPNQAPPAQQPMPPQQLPNQAPPAQQAQQPMPPQPQQAPPQQPQQVQAPNQQDPTVIARKLLHELNLPAEQVAQQTGLPLETVQQLPPF